MRDRIIVGNWKMNKDFEETEKMLTQLKSYSKPSGAKIKIATPLLLCVLDSLFNSQFKEGTLLSSNFKTRKLRMHMSRKRLRLVFEKKL